MLPLVVVVLFPGCAWRTGNVEHYFGPVLFRYSDAAESACNVTDVLGLGILAEGGRQWGLSAGFVNRLAAAPRQQATQTQWTRPWSLWRTTTPREWNLSLLYLRGENVSSPLLVRRQLVGAGVLVGNEITALSVGYASRVNIAPRDDSFSIVVFDSSKPLASRCEVLPASAAEDGALFSALQEVQ